MATLEERYRAGWQALAEGRLEDLLDLYAPDIEVRETGRTFRGRDEVRTQYQSWLNALSDIQVEILDVIETRDALAGEVRMTARHTAPLMTPNGPVPATGRTIQMESCDIAHFKDGLVVSFHSYFDQLAVMAQLGLLGAPQELQSVG